MISRFGQTTDRLGKSALITLFLIVTLGISSVGSLAKVDGETVLLKQAATGHLIVEASVNGTSHKFIVDTGASHTVFDKAAAIELKLSIQQDNTNEGFAAGGTITSTLAEVETLKIGNASFSNRSVFIQDLSGVVSHFDGVVGVIGQDMLVDLDAGIDLAESILRLGISDWFKTHQAHYKTLSLTSLPIGFVTVSAELSGKPVTLIIDSGSADVMLDKAKFDTLDLGALKIMEGAQAFGADGNPLNIYTTPQLELTANGILLGNRPFTVMDLSHVVTAVEAESDAEIYGVIGNSPLRALGGIIHMKAKKLYIKG